MKKPISNESRRRKRRMRKVLVCVTAFLGTAAFGLTMYSIALHSGSFVQGLLYCYSAVCAFGLLLTLWLLVQSRAYWKHRAQPAKLLAHVETILDEPLLDQLLDDFFRSDSSDRKEMVN